MNLLKHLIAVLFTSSLCMAASVNASQFTGVDACAQIESATQSPVLGTRGGEVDATGFSGPQQCSSNPFSRATVPIHFYFSGSVWTTTVQWKLCKNCIAEGNQFSSVVVIAGTGFPANTAILSIGDGTTTFFDTRFNNIQADCGIIPPVGCYLVDLSGTDESSGISVFRGANCNAASGGGCIVIHSPPSTSNFKMENTYILFNSHAQTSADGILVTGTSSQGTWDAITVVGAGLKTTGHAFHCAGPFTGCKIRSIHMESIGDGAYYDVGSWGAVYGAVGDPTNNPGAALVHINTTISVDYSDLMSVNTTFLVKNDITGKNISGLTNKGNVALPHGSFP